MRVPKLLLAGFAVFAALAGCGGGGDSAVYDPDEWTSRQALLARRNELRAYDGAPPVIPHALADLGRQNCRSCHSAGATTNGDRVGPPRSHPNWGDNCVQCHVEQQSGGVFRAASFEPLRWADAGSRQSDVAPPTIPHQIQNRDNCAVCHIGEQAPAALRAAHGMRVNCRQCHAAGAAGL